MSTLTRRVGISALALLGLLAGHDGAWAQFQFGNTPYGLNLNNPYIANRQFLYNMQLGRAAFANSMFNPSPSYALPFPTPAYNPYLPFGANPYLANSNAMGFGANPYAPMLPGGAVDPVTGLPTAGPGSNPYSPYGASGAGAYDPYSNPYSPYSNPSIGPGFTLMGAADVMRAYGNVITSQEQARILREQYYQSKLETQKKKFDLEMYIKNNTPSFTEEQEKVTKLILKRLQGTSNPAEIVDGRSLNFLLDDVDKHRAKLTQVSAIPLPPEILKHINLKPGGLDNFSLGLLRDGGKLNWPTALVDLLPADARAELDSRAQALVQNATKGKDPDRNAIKDFRVHIEQTQARLVKKANDYGTPEYMEAKRYLSDLDSATRAIERGSASVQLEFQQMIAKGEIQTLNDLVGVMVKRGWRFAPSLLTDEAAYRAMHSALVAYDIALNQHVAVADEK